MTITEKGTEKRTINQPEILDINSYGGLYGRLLLASQSSEEEVRNIINPTTKPGIDPSKISISPERNYNPITARLSDDERVDAWKDVKFTDAYAQWRTKLTKSIKSTTDEKRIEAIAVISGKLASEFSEEDADNLYNAFCKGKSDTTGFAKSIAANLQKDGKADSLWLNTLSPGIEWFSGSLFGKETAITVLRMIELETEIANNPSKVVQKLFSDKERINNLTEEETKILTHLYGGLNATRIETESSQTQPDTEPVPFSQWPKNKRMRALEKVIEDIKNDRTPIDPKTGQPIPLGISKDHMEALLNKRILAVKDEPEPASSTQAAGDDSTRKRFLDYLEREKTQRGEGVAPTPLSETIQSASQEPAEPEQTNRPDLEPITNRGILSKGHQIQYQGKPYTISDIEEDGVHLLSLNGQPRTMDRRYLEELLTDPYSPWKLLDEEGKIITLPKIEPEGIDDRDLAPAPIDKDEIPIGTF